MSDETTKVDVPLVQVSTAPASAPASADKKPIEAWRDLKPATAWAHEAAIVQSQIHSPPGWAHIGTMLTEAEYDAGISAALNVKLK